MVATKNPVSDENEQPAQPAREDKVTRMGTASIPRLIVEFAIPSILGMLVNGAYNLIDSIFLGQAMGEIGLATATVAMPVMTVFMAISMLVGNGGNALAALRMGEGNREEAERSLGNTVCLSIILAAVVAVVAHVPACIDGVLGISGATAEDWYYARSFIQIISLGFVFQCIGMGVNNFIRTAGAPNRALSTMIVGAVACTIFNFLFVMVLGWGVQGSALATLFGQAISCACVLWYFLFTKNVPMRLRLRHLPLHARTVGLILSLGLASFAVQAGMAVVNFVLNNLLNLYGSMNPIGAEGALASIGVVQRVAMFTVLPLIGVAIAIQPLLGFNYRCALVRAREEKRYCAASSERPASASCYGALSTCSRSRSSGSSASRMIACSASRCLPSKCSWPCCRSSDSRLWDRTTFRRQASRRNPSFCRSRARSCSSSRCSWCCRSYCRDGFRSSRVWMRCISPRLWADFLAIFTTAVFILLEMGRLRKLERGEIQAKF